MSISQLALYICPNSPHHAPWPLVPTTGMTPDELQLAAQAQVLEWRLGERLQVDGHPVGTLTATLGLLAAWDDALSEARAAPCPHRVLQEEGPETDEVPWNDQQVPDDQRISYARIERGVTLGFPAPLPDGQVLLLVTQPYQDWATTILGLAHAAALTGQCLLYQPYDVVGGMAHDPDYLRGVIALDESLSHQAVHQHISGLAPGDTLVIPKPTVVTHGLGWAVTTDFACHALERGVRLILSVEASSAHDAQQRVIQSVFRGQQMAPIQLVTLD